MAYKTLLFGTDDLFETFKSFYLKEVERGNLEIVAAAVLENENINFVTYEGMPEQGSVDIDVAIISSENHFYERTKKLEAMGVPRARIIDGRAFYVQNLDFPRLVNEGVAYGTYNPSNFYCAAFSYPSNYKSETLRTTIKLGRNSFIGNSSVEEDCMMNHSISVENFSAISLKTIFQLGTNRLHNFKNVTQYDLSRFGWEYSGRDFLPSLAECKILIGSDVWIGRGCILKCTNPAKPLVIGDGAVVASDSVVVKDVPPYAIVGGNPAQIIKYRFPPHVIEALLRIKWWDWSLDKIHDNFKYFNDIEKFISLHDKEG